jgi:hypothetical protein
MTEAHHFTHLILIEMGSCELLTGLILNHYLPDCASQGVENTDVSFYAQAISLFLTASLPYSSCLFSEVCYPNITKVAKSFLTYFYQSYRITALQQIFLYLSFCDGGSASLLM